MTTAAVTFRRLPTWALATFGAAMGAALGLGLGLSLVP